MRVLQKLESYNTPNATIYSEVVHLPWQRQTNHNTAEGEAALPVLVKAMKQKLHGSPHLKT